MVYKAKLFMDSYGLVQFLNSKKLKPENIISVISEGYGVYTLTLIYAEEK